MTEKAYNKKSSRIAPAKKAPTRATVAVGCGLLLFVLGILVAPMNVRDVSVFLNRDQFVRDEFEVDYFSEGRKSNTLGGHVVSTGETLSTRNEGIIISGGLDRRRRLQAEKLLVGHRFPVFYLPAQGFWGFVDMINQFRVISPDEFEASDDAAVWVWLGIGAAIWISGVLLFRWGVKLATTARGSEA